MKKNILLLFAAFATLAASAHDFEVNGIYYNKTSSTTAEVTYKGSSYSAYSNEYSGSITIPATVTRNGVAYSVTSIGSGAFYDCSSLTAITIPEGVTSIGGWAFSDCSSLTAITIPESVTSIGGWAFSDCSSLTSIVVAEGNTKYDSRDGCNAIIETNSNTLIAGCSTTIIPEGVTSIGSYAFGGCSNLTFITIPASVTSIGSNAFYNCRSLTSITIPYSVTSIGWSAFSGCTSLTSITIPASVTSIGSDAFYNCRSLTSITIPASVTSIGSDAFYNCRSLTSITIPASVTSIGSNAFDGTAWYNNQSYGVVYAGKVLYKYKGTMPANTSIEVKEGTVSISPYAFYNCSSLTSITIPESVTSIGSYAFDKCSLTEITFPENSQLTSIGNYAFYNCSSLTSIALPESVTSIGEGAFRGCSSLTSITIPEGVTSIGYYAFYNCSNLTSITIPYSVTWIEEYAFYNCRSLTSINIPASVTSIGESAFVNCTGLTSITCYAAIPPACGGYAFDGIYKQVPVYVPATSISKYWYADGWKEFTNYQPLVVVTDITLSQSTASLFVGEELVLTAEVAPDNAPNPTLAWSSSDPSVASVDITGKVVALAPGTAIVTATANDGSGVSASCEVIVRPAPAERCAAPVISYVGGKVVLTCTTEGAKVITTVTADNDNTFEVLSFDYIPTHTFTAYATKENYANSDEVTLTLCWIPCTEEHKEDEGTNEEGNGNDDTEEEEEDNGILNIPSQPVLIQCTGGTITVSGLAAGTEVKVYDTAGTQQGAATATDGTATLATNLTAGSIAIVKIGDYSIKVAIK